MGANAQTAVPVFTAGQVLTAQQQTEINTGIPVFATTVTRDAAFGGTGEKTLAEGQFAYIEATNTTQYYDGANWQTVGVTPGLVCVQAETAFTTASTVTADNVFTSSYTNYRMIVRFQGTTGSDLLMQFRAGGVDTATNYNYQSFTSNSTTNTGAVASSQTTIPVAQNSTGVISLVTLEISGPQLAAPTFTQSLNTRHATVYTGPNIAMFFGNQSASTQFDGFKFSGTSGTFTGSYTIYGYSKTV